MADLKVTSFLIFRLKLIQPDTKMICLNNANNPTGTILDKNFLEQVVEIAKSVGAYVLVDEVYLPFDHPEDFTPIVDLDDKGISTNSLSKAYSVPGVRIGWTATNAELADIFRKFRDYTMICGGVFNDQLATYVLRHRDQVLARNRKLIFGNLAIYKDWIDHEDQASVVMQRAVSTSLPKLDVPVDIHIFCENLLKDEGVLLVPGDAFDTPGHARLGYCAPEATLCEGLKRLSKYMQQYG